MFIRNMMDPNGRGTYISAAGRTGTHETCTTSLEYLAIIEARTRILQDGSSQQENIGARVTKVLEALKIPVWLSIRGAHGQAISVVVPVEKESQACAAINTELSAEIASHEVDSVNSEFPVTMLSVVAEDLSKVPNHRTKVFGSLADAGIKVLAIGQGTSPRSLSCVVRGIDTKVAVRRVHDAFNVDYLVTNVVLLGCNHIALDVVRQLQKQQELYRSQHKVRVNIVGFNSNCYDFVYDPKGFGYEELVSRLEDSKSKNAMISTSSTSESILYAGAPSLEQLNQLQELSIPIVLDCSGQGCTQDLYSACIDRGIHIVTSNARSVCRLPSTSSRESVAVTTRTMAGRAFFMYTSTIGASLPIIDTLGNILRTGDRILGIDTSLSGSMNFVANEVMKGKKLSEAVGEVLCRGYCERDPREDFTGTDMVEKLWCWLVLSVCIYTRVKFGWSRSFRIAYLVLSRGLTTWTWATLSLDLRRTTKNSKRNSTCQQCRRANVFTTLLRSTWPNPRRSKPRSGLCLSAKPTRCFTPRTTKSLLVSPPCSTRIH